MSIIRMRPIWAATESFAAVKEHGARRSEDRPVVRRQRKSTDVVAAFGRTSYRSCCSQAGAWEWAREGHDRTCPATAIDLHNAGRVAVVKPESAAVLVGSSPARPEYVPSVSWRQH